MAGFAMGVLPVAPGAGLVLVMFVAEAVADVDPSKQLILELIPSSEVPKLVRLDPPPMPALPELPFFNFSPVTKSLSLGEPSVREDMDELRFMVDDTLSVHGYSKSTHSADSASLDKHVSTIASRQLTNNSALSRLDSVLEKGPAKRQRPPNPKAREKELV